MSNKLNENEALLIGELVSATRDLPPAALEQLLSVARGVSIGLQVAAQQRTS